MPDILIVGIGNPYRGDDGAGWAVIDLLQESLTHQIKLCKQNSDLAELLDLLSHHSTVYLIDACLTKAPTGSWQRIDVHTHPLNVDKKPTSTHGFTLIEALEMAKNLDQLPTKIIVYAVVGEHFSLSENLSPSVKKATLAIANTLLQEEDIQACMKKA